MRSLLTLPCQRKFVLCVIRNLSLIALLPGLWGSLAQAEDQDYCHPSSIPKKDAPYSFEETKALSKAYGDRIIFQAGKDIMTLGPTIGVLNEDGHPTDAVVGNDLPGDRLRMVIGGRGSKTRMLTQKEVDNGDVLYYARKFHELLLRKNKITPLEPCADQETAQTVIHDQSS